MPRQLTSGELIRQLSNFDPDIPILVPTPAPTEYPETESWPAYNDPYAKFVSSAVRDRRTHILLGDYRQAAAEHPELEHTARLTEAVQREIAQLEELTNLSDLRPLRIELAPEPERREDRATIRNLTSGRQDPQGRAAVILQGSAVGEEYLLLVLTAAKATTEDCREADSRAQTLRNITGRPTAAVVACLETEEQPPLTEVPIHILAWAAHECQYCNSTFNTARAFRIHLMLEAGSAELRNNIPGYWQRYMDDLKRLTDLVDHHFQEDYNHKRKPQHVSCAGCGSPYMCRSCQEP